MKAYILISLIFVLIGCRPGWHTFQSNNARTGLVDRPAIHNPKVLWKTYIGIQGYLNNSIAISKKIFVGSSGSEHNTTDSLDGIYCINKENGKVLWHFKTITDASGVAFSKNKIYATGDDGYLRCLDANSGVEIWNIKREGELYSQPLIINDLVIIGDETGTILMVNQNSGKIIIEKKVANSNVRGALSSDGENIYATFMEGIIASLDLKGNVNWKIEGEFHGRHGEDFESIYGAPTISGNQLIVPFIRNTYYTTPAVYSYNKTDGTLIWKATDEGYNDNHGNIRSSIAIWKNYIFYGSPYSNKLTVLHLDDGMVAWEIGLGESTDPHWPSPVIANKVLYLARHDGGLNAIDLEHQKVMWQLFLGDSKNIKNRPQDYGSRQVLYASRNGFPIPSIYATPSIDEKGTLYIGSGEGWMYAIGSETH